MEALLHEKTFWTTLTYNQDFLPTEFVRPDTGEFFEHPQGVLHPVQIELFIKRVRKKLPPKSFRYFLVGEYGDADNRPHYHICIFGHGEEILPRLQAEWSDPISKLPFGFVDRKKCGPITTQNARYTCGYTLKKLTKSNDPRLEGRYPEFTSHSTGIGLEFAKRYADSLCNQSGLAHILATGDIPRSVRFDGQWWPLDRYLREKALNHMSAWCYRQGINFGKDKFGFDMTLYDALKMEGQKRFKKEMFRLSIRAEENPKFASPSISSMMMQKQYQADTHQQVLNTEKRAKLYMKGT